MQGNCIFASHLHICAVYTFRMFSCFSITSAGLALLSLTQRGQDFAFLPQLGYNFFLIKPPITESFYSFYCEAALQETCFSEAVADHDSWNSKIQQFLAGQTGREKLDSVWSSKVLRAHILNTLTFPTQTWFEYRFKGEMGARYRLDTVMACHHGQLGGGAARFD